MLTIVRSPVQVGLCAVLAMALASCSRAQPELVGWHAVPLSITGLTRVGKDRFLASNDGRRFKGDVYRPSIVLLSADFRVLREWQLPGISGSVQGITTAPDGTAWFAEQGDDSLRRISLRTGREVGRIEMNRGEPNGVLWLDGRLLVSYRRNSRLIALDPTAADDRAPLAVIETNIARPDQLARDGDRVFVTAGKNGSAGMVFVFTLDWRRKRVWVLPWVTALEGLVIEGRNGWFAQDGGLHRQAKPARNLIGAFRLPAKLADGVAAGAG